MECYLRLVVRLFLFHLHALFLSCRGAEGEVAGTGLMYGSSCGQYREDLVAGDGGAHP